ncbi:hypothetical protein Barb6_00775 [Bacteroidales bacterium Barb6]|nr:hypothetical protein Barb6_00775 [Bacteroidales bacterium Barb6]
MRRFILKITILATIILSIYIFIFFFLPYNPDNYYLAYNKKCALLQQDSTAPRLIFVGGSSLNFSIDSKMIKDSLHINVINYGLTGGIGLKYMIDDISSYAKENDIIVFAPEYCFFFEEEAYGLAEALSHIMYLTGYKKMDLLNTQQKINVLKGLPSICEAKIKYLLSPFHSNRVGKEIYSVSGFNEYGDYCRHWDLSMKQEFNLPKKSAYFNHEFGEYFVKKIKDLKNKSCEVIIIPPIIIESGFRIIKENAEEVNAFLLKNEIPFLVPPQNHVVPDDYAFNSYSHVNREGVDFYSASIIKELNAFFKYNNPSYQISLP